MTRAQRVVILIGLAVIAGLAVFPPWHGTRYAAGPSRIYDISIGRHCYLAPPPAGPQIVREHGERIQRNIDKPRIDAGRLLVECILVGAITAGIVVVLGGRKKPAPTN